MDIDVIIGLIVFFTAILLLVGVAIFAILYQFVLDSVRKDFLNTLEDREIAVIKAYECCRPSFTQFCAHFRRSKKNG